MSDLTNPYYGDDIFGSSNVLATGTNVPAPTTNATPTQTPSWLTALGAVENDIIYGFKAITQPTPPPGMIGASISGGTAGTQVSISPIFLIAILAVVYLIVERR